MGEIKKFSTNNTKVLSNKVFKVWQELIMESILIDPINAIPTVSKATNFVHNGEMFSINAKGTLGVGESIYLTGVTSDKEVHFNLFHINTSHGMFSIELYEDPTVTSLGVLIDAINRKRSSNNTNTMATYVGSTVSDVGTLLDITEIYDTGGTGSNVIKGYGELGVDWVLSANSTYLIKFTNNDSTSMDYTGNFVWAEKEPI